VELLNSSREMHKHTALVDHAGRGIEKQPERHLGSLGIKLMNNKKNKLLMRKTQ